LNILNIRAAGILLHVTSLPGGYGIGDFGPEAYAFVDWLEDAGMKLWQMLPLGPTGYGNSPYSARSSFAGNELLVSPDLLVKDGWITEADCNAAFSGLCTNPAHVDFNTVAKAKLPLLEKAAANALEDSSFCAGLDLFCRKQAFWLDDYALFMLLCRKYNDARWYSIWDRKEGFRDPDVLQRLREEKRKELDVFRAVQFFFDRQCGSLKSYAETKGIFTIGDIPIFTGMDSADTWSDLRMFKTDGHGHFTDVSGVPPDGFSADGQLWGTPVYDWDFHLKTGFSWWISRIARCLELNHIVRIDHFRGLAAFYDIPAGSPDARVGTWVKAPGFELFDAIRRQMGQLPVIAEDLGNITPDVVRLRRTFGLPGMKIAQFGFGLGKNGKMRLSDSFLPHKYPCKCVAYTGTHDNDTTRGWFDSLEPRLAKEVLSYLGADEASVVRVFVKVLMHSNANTVIVPMQDVLGLDGSARMNYPSSCNDVNWSWRMVSQAGVSEARFLKSLASSSGR